MNTHTLPLRKIIAALALAGAAMVPQANAFHVKDGLLFDNFNTPFIMRGVNHAHTWYETQTPQALRDIAGVNANAVRIVLSNGAHQEGWGRDSEAAVAEIITQMKELQMVSIVEVHDATGYPEKAGAAHMSKAVDYWIDIADALKGEEDYVIINIANEPFGNGVEAAVWINDHIEAIQRLRDAGFTHTLMIDAASWGQDWEQIMLEHAPEVFAADPLKNIVFSVHMYQIYNNRDTIDSYLRTFVYQHQLPLVIGEFGADHAGEDVDEASILELADRYNLGYLGWSWSGNSGGVESLDITLNYDVNNLSEWGDFLINSEYGLKATAQTCSCFTEGSGPIFPPKAVPFTHTLLENTTADFPLAGNDIDGEIVESIIVTAPAHGSLIGNGASIRYTPNANFSGVDEFEYILVDDDGAESDPAKATLVVASAGGIGGVAACSVNLVRFKEWDKGSHLKLEVTNQQAAAITGYDLVFTIGDSEEFSGGYSATNFIADGQQITVTVDASHWNGTLNTGDTAVIDYQISKASNGPAVQPAYYFLNNLTCPDASFTGTASSASSTSRASSSNASIIVSSSSSSSESSSLLSSESSSSSSSSSSSATTSSTSGECHQLCKWYQDEPRPLCQNQDSGWGWENQQTCIGVNTCESQFGNGGVVNVCDDQTTSSSSLDTSSSVPSSRSTDYSSSTDSNSSTNDSSSVPPLSSSSSTASGNVTCEVSLMNQWGTGYQLDITVTNNSPTTINGWGIELDYGQAPQITGSWNAEVSATTTGIEAGNIGWNGHLGSGESTSFGLQGKSNGNLQEPICTVVE